MVVSEIIKEIEVYLSLNPIKEERHSKKFLRNICGIVADVLPMHGAVGAIASASFGNNNSMLVEDILGYCNDAQLDEMLQEYGEESDLGQMIRRKRAMHYSRTSCDVETVASEIEKEIKSSQSNNPFYESVCFYMGRIGIENDADFYNSIGMPRQLFAKLRDPKNTLSKKTVLWVISGLNVNYNEANDLLRKAGYSFRNSDLRDVVLSYIFRNTDYDLWKVNEILEHFDIEPFC